jgi:hypothetical protein
MSDPIILGGPLCLVSDEIIFTPGVGRQRVQTFKGRTVEVQNQADLLANLGWSTRLNYNPEGLTLQATAPEIITDEDGNTAIDGAEDQWNFTTEIIDADYWASPMLFKKTKAILNLSDDATRARLTFWRAMIEQNLKVKYGPDAIPAKDSDGTRLAGPTSMANFQYINEDGYTLPPPADGSIGMIKEIYEWLAAGQKSVLTSNVSIQRRRQVPVKSALRFKADAIQYVWPRAKFITEFKIPTHIQTLLPVDSTQVPFTTAVWGYRLRRHDAEASAANSRVVENLEWVYAAWSNITHDIK